MKVITFIIFNLQLPNFNSTFTECQDYINDCSFSFLTTVAT